ncbi:hypothetical protein F5141DRAFT_1220199 [Pisolithus sp. B1]|nr:hypothetical protein F5141DRAFT_1220199 [Pisolithus sp. B1]
MSISNSSSYWGNGHQSKLTEPYDDYLAVAQPQWSLTSLDGLEHELVTPSASKNVAKPGWQCSHSTVSVEVHGGRANGVETDMFEGSTTRSQRSSALADDERLIRRPEEEPREGDWRMRFVWGVIRTVLDGVQWYACPRRREVWLSIIEGNADDDLWLWADGDTDWLAKHEKPYSRWLDPDDWLDAQSALRRRVTLQRYPPATARNEKVRSATPEQRVSAIAWLIASSKAVVELFASHGRTPPTFRTPEIACTLDGIIGQHWHAFPSQTDAWENVLRKSEEDGCICSLADCRGMRQWFDMMVWLEDDIPPNLEVGNKPCVRCRSLLKSRYDDITAKYTVTSSVSLLDAFYDYFARSYRDNGDHVERLLSPADKLLAASTLEPLMKKHGCNMQYFPSVNRYPQCLRQGVTDLLCGSCENDLPTAEHSENILDGAHDPWVVLGIFVWATCCHSASTGEGTNWHDNKWHDSFSFHLHRSLQCLGMPMLPRLPSASLTLGYKLTQDRAEECLLETPYFYPDEDDDFDRVYSGEDGQQLSLSTAVMAAVATFLRNKDVDLPGCRRCHNICMEFFTGTPSAVVLEVANSSKREGLGPAAAHIRGEDDAPGGGRSSALQGSLDASMQVLAGMDPFATDLRNPTSSEDEVPLQMVGGFLKLRQDLESHGVDASHRFHRSDGGSRPRLEHLLGHGTSSQKLSKPDKVGEIKDKLLDMLRKLSLPYERLPWYTLETELEKHGCTLVNWPAGVVRKRGNRGIHDLSTVQVNSLYIAITRPDESHRLRICRRPSPLTVAPVRPVNHSPAAASGSKRLMEELDLPGLPSKRIRFKDMTSKVLQQHLIGAQEDAVP